MDKQLDKEELIIKAAMDVFIEKGRHGARMQEIADRAGINKALLHYYFRNKENLYRQIFERVFGKFIKSMALKLDPSKSPSETIRFFINGFIDMLRSNEKAPLFMMRELSEGGKTVSDVLNQYISVEEEGPVLLVKYFENAKQKGQLRHGIDSLQLLLTILGSCIYFFMAEPLIKSIMQWPPEFNRDDFIENRKKAIFDIIYNGIKPQGEDK